ncbi:MAG TPA: leucyl aminopeptidase [Nocardioidaceae bacterium]|nr:leucyl aminopeptidase [Nocardioidaceae bacterium]
MTNISLRKAAPHKTKADALVVGVVKSGKGVAVAAGGEDVAAAFGRSFDATCQAMGVKGSVGEVTKLPAGGAVKAPLVVLVGLGVATDLTPEVIRRAVGSAVRSLGDAKSVALALPASSSEQVRASAEGVLLGGYAFTRYRSDDESRPPEEAVVLTDLARSKAVLSDLEAAKTVSRAVNAARDLVNTPASDLNPVTFADYVVEQARGTKVSVDVLDERDLEGGGYGGILGVGQGSATPPRLVTMTYKPRGAKAHIALVGKGITFDSGGLSIKPTSGMATMKCDMSGAAAVVSATLAIAQLGLPVQVTGYAALAENMPSGTATRPGDVLKMHGGKTVEVLNTDAEGRLVLADAITAANELKPDLIVDVATLTGACVIALGTRTSGIMANRDKLADTVREEAARVGENMWHLPIPEEMNERVRGSKVADLAQHSSERAGSALFAAAFLREFVGDGVEWAHLDIAGTAFNDGGPWGYTPHGGTGAAVRTLVQLAASRAG